MTSLDCARYELAINGAEMMKKAIGLAGEARDKINKIKGFNCMESGKGELKNADLTRLVISARGLGITGFELDKLLFEKYNVNMELSDYENVLAIVTYANEREDLDRLVAACQYISRNCPKSKGLKNEDKYPEFPPVPRQLMTPRRAYFSKTKEIKWKDAAGKISAQMIAPYPPGIPVVYPGELITDEVWQYIDCFRKDDRHIHGLAGETIKILE
jgi:arginine/lysine/ornithine decarboxylase